MQDQRGDKYGEPKQRQDRKRDIDGRRKAIVSPLGSTEAGHRSGSFFSRPREHHRKAPGFDGLSSSNADSGDWERLPRDSRELGFTQTARPQVRRSALR